MPTYRQLQAAEAINPNLPSTDIGLVAQAKSAAAQELGDSIANFANNAGRAIGKYEAKRGEEAGAAAGAGGSPEFKRGFAALGDYAKAYNNAAYREYAVVADAQVEDAATQAELNANGDPRKYSAAMTAARDKAVKEAQPELRTMLTQTYNQHITRGTKRLTVEQAVAQKERNRQVLSEGIQRSTDRIARGYAANDSVEYGNALIEQEKLTMLLDASVEDGTITAVERKAMQQTTQRSITKQTFTAEFNRVLEDPKGDPVQYIKNLKEQNKTSEALLPDEEEKLVGELLQELQQHNALEAAGISATKGMQKAKFDAGNRQSTYELLTNTLTRRKIAEMVKSQDLDPDRATTLNNELGSGGPSVDDPKKYFHTVANLLEYTPDEISTMPGLTLQTRKTLWDRREQEAKGWRSQPNAVEAKHRIDRALGVPEGGGWQMLEQAKADARDKTITQWNDTVALLPPAEREGNAISIADEMIAKHIKNSAVLKAGRVRERKEALMKASGNPNDMSKARREKYEEQLSRYDKQIADLDKEAGR